jgi:alpha-1,6-mannosyltransferase
MSVHGPLGATSQGGAFELTTSGLGTRAAPRTRAGLLGLAGLLACGLLISVAAANTDILLPESVRPMPSGLAGPFGITGLDLGEVGVIAVLSAMFAAYVVAVGAADRLSPRAVLMTIAGLHALVVLAPPLLSTDIFSYSAYGRMGALYGTDPYLHGPHAIALDQVFPYVGAKWSYIPTVYGPVFTTLSYILAPLSIAASILAYKAIAVLASLVTVALVWNAARLRGVDPVKGVALVGLNPLLVVYGVGGGHNDLMMITVMVIGVYFVLQHRERAAGATMIVATGIKLTAGLLLPFAIAGGTGRRAGNPRRELLIGAAIAAATLGVLTLVLFGTGSANMLGTVQQAQSQGDWHSIPGFVSTRLGLGTIGHLAGLGVSVIFVGVLCWLVWKTWRGEIDWIHGAGWATVALLVTAGALLPWYVAWLLPLVALSSDRRLWRTTIVMTGFVLAIQIVGYVPHASSLLGL